MFFFLGLSFVFSCAPDASTAPDTAHRTGGKYTVPRRTVVSGVAPLLQTEWGQAGVWQQSTPTLEGEPTYPGCTTIASAQVLFYYQYQNYADSDVCYDLEHEVLSEDVEGGVTLCVDFASNDIQYDWDGMALHDEASTDATLVTSEFIYHVGVTLNAQFGGGEGSSATARQIENAFRYQWGFDKRREDGSRARSVTIVMKDEFFDSDADFADHLRMELNAGRPVMYMAQQVDAETGHAFVIDGYNQDGLFHVNWGWGGSSNGYYDLSMTDDSGRSWSRNAMIYQYLEPEQDYSLQAQQQNIPTYSWNGNGSLISYSSGEKTGYGFTIDEAAIHPTSQDNPIVFFQWEIDKRDGTRLKIDAETMETATITYGPWNNRAHDITFEDVSLPFVLDPETVGFSDGDQEYHVVAVAFSDKPASRESVVAEVTTEAGTAATGVAAAGFVVDGGVWSGTGSLIDASSGTQEGYGLNLDEGLIVPSAAGHPQVFFQWELDPSSGEKLQLSADGMTADVTYGIWNDRSTDVTHSDVSMPFTIDPAADGLSVASGEYYVIKVAFTESPPTDVPVMAAVIR